MCFTANFPRRSCVEGLLAHCHGVVVQILGWSDKSFSLIRELCLAMESEGGGTVVVLSLRDKDEVEGEVWSACGTIGWCWYRQPMGWACTVEGAVHGEGVVWVQGSGAHGQPSADERPSQSRRFALVGC